MLEHQRYYVILFSALFVLGGVFYLGLPQMSYATGKLTQAEQKRWERHRSAPNNVSVVHVDFTQSDKTISLEQGPYRRLLTGVLKKDLKSEKDVLTAYLVHNETHNNQAFYATHSVFTETEVLGEDLGAAWAKIEQSKCLEKFDSLAHLYEDQYMLDIADSSLMRYTNILGAIQNAALYFRRYADDKDQKNLYFLSDMRENSVFLTPVARVDQLSSMEQINSLLEVAENRLEVLTDVQDELEGAHVYMITPNEHLYSSKGRNFTRMFWERFFIEKLSCERVYFQ